jgi:hypothetical protein
MNLIYGTIILGLICIAVNVYTIIQNRKRNRNQK